MTTIQVDVPPEMYRTLVAEAARLGKPTQLLVQEWVIERATATDLLAHEHDQALAVLRRAGLLTELSPDEQARAAACTATLEDVQEALSRGGGKPLSEIIIEQRGPKE